jgi:hypothetical protein
MAAAMTYKKSSGRPLSNIALIIVDVSSAVDEGLFGRLEAALAKVLVALFGAEVALFSAEVALLSMFVLFCVV